MTKLLRLPLLVLALCFTSSQPLDRRPAASYEFAPLWLPDLRGVVGPPGAGLRLPGAPLLRAPVPAPPRRPAATGAQQQSSLELGPPGAVAAEFVVGSGGLDQNRRVDGPLQEEDDIPLLPQNNVDKVRRYKRQPIFASASS